MTDTPDHIVEIASGLSSLEREWITGWQGVAGAAFNVVAVDLQRKGLLKGVMNWNLNELGQRVRHYLQENDDGK